MLFAAWYVVVERSADPRLLLGVGLLNYLIFPLYFGILTARNGQTLGKAAMGIQVQGANGGPPTPSQAWLRPLAEMGFWVIPFGIGAIEYFGAFGRRRQTGHDMVCGTMVRQRRRQPNLALTVLLLFGALAFSVGAREVGRKLTLSGRQTQAEMAPTIAKGEAWLANRQAYKTRAPQVGDVVAFRDAQLKAPALRSGRVVGVGGDNLVYRDGQAVRLASVAADAAQDVVRVPVDAVAVLFDNPDRVSTTPPIQIVPREKIRGQIIGVTRPIYRLRTIQ